MAPCHWSFFKRGREHTHPVTSGGERLVNVVDIHLCLDKAGVGGVDEDFSDGRCVGGGVRIPANFERPYCKVSGQDLGSGRLVR